MKFEELTTSRLRLRKIGPEELIYIHTQLSPEEQMSYLGLDSEEDLEKEKKKFQGGLWTHNKRPLYFHLVDKKSDAVIGWCGYHTWYTDHARAEIGYGLLKEEYKRKGLMTEAIKPILDYGFNQMNLNRIEAFVAPYNVASNKVMGNNGFVKEGHLRSHYFFEGKHDDSYLYSLLRSDYLSTLLI